MSLLGTVLTRLVLLAAIVAVGGISGRAVPADGHSSTPVKTQVQALEKRLGNSDFWSTQKRDLSELKRLMRAFVTHEITASPWMTAEQLRHRLAFIYPCEECDTPPYAFVDFDWGPRTTARTWAVIYWVYLGTYGPTGSVAVIDSYTWRNGKTQFVGEGGTEMTGASLEVNRVDNPSFGHVSVLANGVTLGASGRTIASRVTLYDVGPEGVRLLWQIPHLGSLSVGAQRTWFELFYEDDDRVYHSPPLPDPDVVEVYIIDSSSPKPRLIVKKHYTYH